LLVREARRMGIEQIIVTHPVNRLSLEQQKEAAGLGAYLEYCFVGTLPFAGARRKTFAEYAEIMKALGAEHVIMSSDLGNAANPLHPAGWRSYIAGLLEAGMSEGEIDLMARRNPARLLGLE
jgi:microsomal dipeptidase-like Zn-dependent dipeptidase